MRAFRLVALCAPLILVGCGTARVPVASGPAGVRAPVKLATFSDDAVAERLREVSEPWMGVPYRFGGTERSGVDCSAFVRAVMDEGFGVRLSRSTRTQVTEGEPIAADALRPGDLVFFRRGGKNRHVGAYLGDGTFVHASTSSGVTISSLDEDYYRKYYWTARRVIEAGSPPLAASAPIAAPPAPRPEPEPHSAAAPASSAGGWSAPESGTPPRSRAGW